MSLPYYENLGASLLYLESKLPVMPFSTLHGLAPADSETPHS